MKISKILSLLFYYILIILFLKGIDGRAQNLVQNYNFENYISCPIAGGDIDQAVGWSSFNQSPDYFNSCNINCIPYFNCFGIPSNHMGSQEAKDGNGYAGIVTFDDGFATEREIVGSNLLQPLTIGEKYYISFYTSRAGGFSFWPQHGDGASNNLGVRFFMNSYDTNHPCPIDNFAHLNCDSIIIDSINWTRISGSFIADSSYQFIGIGNFFDPNHTDTLDFGMHDSTLSNWSYYYIDEVCVSTDSQYCQLINKTQILNNEIKLNIFPNPFIEDITIVFQNNLLSEIIFYDTFYRKITSKKFINKITINTSQFDSGIIFYKIISDNYFDKSGKLFKY